MAKSAVRLNLPKVTVLYILYYYYILLYYIYIIYIKIERGHFRTLFGKKVGVFFKKIFFEKNSSFTFFYFLRGVTL